MKFKIMDLNAINVGSGIVITIGLNRRYGEQVDKLLNGFNPTKDYELKEVKEKRSLSSNAYTWVLCDELAKVLKITKEEVYRNAISYVGVFEEVKVSTPEAAKRFKKIWYSHGVGWLTKTVNETTIHAYYGSSVYNTAEMSRIIEFLQDECRRQGIEIRPKEEVESMLKEWEKEHG